MINLLIIGQVFCQHHSFSDSTEGIGPLALFQLSLDLYSCVMHFHEILTKYSLFKGLEVRTT